ncbi:MAG TPA: sigma-70 family RNA polymerase sigma factor [Planctomicrobium sp.]|nr:sigma-70 family RNA polymerase sigma factor [Planctomicrobium sp.]
MDRHQELARLWTRNLSVVEAYLFSLWGRGEEVEELLQETITQIFQQIDKYDFDRPFLPWALGVARNVVFRHRRDFARHRQVYSQKALENLTRAFEEVSETEEILRRSLRECFARLTVKSRQICRLRYEQNLGREEIAKRQGISVNAVKIGLYRLREQLRTCIKRRLQSRGLP